MRTLTRLSGTRLGKGLERHGMSDGQQAIKRICEVLERRGVRDQDLHKMFWDLIPYLEPPGCDMAHCSHAGTSAHPMNCVLERYPSRCPIYREFKKRRAEREAKREARAQAECPAPMTAEPGRATAAPGTPAGQAMAASGEARGATTTTAQAGWRDQNTMPPGSPAPGLPNGRATERGQTA